MEYINFDEAMTAEEFIRYCVENYAYMEESYGEHLTQYQSECALYGDAGPGQGLRLQEMRAEMRGMEARYEQLTGRSLQSDAYPYGWEEEYQNDLQAACGGLTQTAMEW